jgi:phosphoribosyl-AMP cyclohydrolase
MSANKKLQEFMGMVKYDANGLVPAIVQDAQSGEVLMLAYMNSEALEKTIQSRRTHFYSRSRKKQWLKGESSGHIQEVQSMYFDCDKDTILIKATQKGGACHAGYYSCFFTELSQNGSTKITGKKVFEP